ncbi:hypothetical protein JCM16814_14640 [Desulfobaculum senezii]|jgi:hypothetical protein|uniref:zinc ribbon domain-containing protein n=1 Tax=Desulfobaculum sp. SPO524 TaxID=3378071 RepID=UPI00385188EF
MGKTKCPHCHHDITTETRYCPSCGVAIIPPTVSSYGLDRPLRALGVFLVIMGAALFALKAGESQDAITMAGVGLCIAIAEGIVHLFRHG